MAFLMHQTLMWVLEHLASKEDLQEQMTEIHDVPKNWRLYFWYGELWLGWKALDDLLGPEEDPLRIKVVRPQYAGTLLCPGLMHLSSCAHQEQYEYQVSSASQTASPEFKACCLVA